MKTPITCSGLCMLVASMCLGPFVHASETTASLGLAASATLVVSETECKNSRGPRVTVEGIISFEKVCAKVILSNNRKGTHTATVQREHTVALALDEAITIPKQPVRGGVGGNPHIWIQYADGDGNSLSEEIYLGRCVQGLKLSADLMNLASVHVITEATGCSNRRGPFITLGGEIVLSGLNAKLIFRNNRTGTHTAEATADVTLVAEGTKIVLPKQPVRGGVGGNPIISLQFVDCESGEPLTEPAVLGRCNEL